MLYVNSSRVSFFLVALLICTTGCGTAAQTVQEVPAAGPVPEVDPTELPTRELGMGPMQQAEAIPDTMRAGRYDNGKMWTFENPPLDYLEDTYGFRPDEAWLDKARLSALRIPGCSASFVSPNGLIATNHHCARGAIVRVSEEGENLLDDGFTAETLADERRDDEMYADQLIAIEDVTGELDAALSAAQTDAERADARQTATQAIEARLADEYGEGAHVEVVALYNGGTYSAYVFRRYADVRLVAAPELQLGYFGGDADNFTYPRYALDFALLRVYGDDGQPLNSADHYFPISEEGVDAGDLVFVIGNPGSTSRLLTTAQLRFRRDVEVENMLEFLDTRIAALDAYLATDPESGLRNRLFSLKNAQKAYQGRQVALADSIIIARRRDAERQFRDAIEADSALKAAYGSLFDTMADVQREKLSLALAYRAFNTLGNQSYNSATLYKGIVAAQLLSAQANGAPESALDELRAQLLSMPSQPEYLDRLYLTAAIEAMQPYFAMQGMGGPRPLRGQPDALAAQVLDQSVLTDSAATADALVNNQLANDPAVIMAGAILPEYAAFARAANGLDEQERELSRQLGRARFDVYGIAVPPDATFSPRFTDGIVKGYDYNGTTAPPHTTFHGLYDHYYSYGSDSEWNLPERWLSPPAAFDRATPLNFVSTSDTIGGNSGSPAVNRDLELVGLNFDRTIEGLARDFIYLPDRGRNVMVDTRAVLEALDDIYDLDRAVLELKTGQLYETEADADAVMAP